MLRTRLLHRWVGRWPNTLLLLLLWLARLRWTLLGIFVLLLLLLLLLRWIRKLVLCTGMRTGTGTR